MADFLLSWRFWALLSAGFAALTAILAKVGVSGVESEVATFVRTLVILCLTLGVVLATGQGGALARVPGRGLTFLVLSGLATGASWLCYFRALSLGEASRVAPLDKLSVIFVAVLGALPRRAALGLELARRRADRGGRRAGGRAHVRRLAACLAAALPASAAPASEPFVDARALVPGLVVDMRYAGERNFVGRRIAGYEAPRCLLTRAAAEAVSRAQGALAPRGYGLKVFDCYRPARAVADFVAWARDAGDTRTKAAFYPRVDKRDLFRLGYIAAVSSHARGSTVDLTLVRLSDGAEVDMGTPFDFFDPTSAPGSRLVTAGQRADRARLRAALVQAGFLPYAGEWWHFTLAREPYPRTSFDHPVR